MTDTTKLDLSRAERYDISPHADGDQAYFHADPHPEGEWVKWDDYATLLDAKEASEEALERTEKNRDAILADLTEARASVAAAWEAGRDAAALMAKECWRDGFDASPHIPSIPNPYRQPKETAHG